MKVDGKPMRTIWPDPGGGAVWVIDQTRLPHALEVRRLASLEDAAHAIETMQVRGAPLIGATAAYGLCLALDADPGDAALRAARERLLATRPTAVNLRTSLDAMQTELAGRVGGDRVAAAWERAARLCDEDVEACRRIGEHGLGLLREVAARRAPAPLRVLTHCNAGWLACVDWGTALAPVYRAHDAGLAVEVWVDETRPRLQGASLTAWELARQGVRHTVICDGAAAHLMQRGEVDLCITGADRVTTGGDVANKIGTYGVALAARDNRVPFYVAMPGSTIDWTLDDGLAHIPIEERGEEEVTRVRGRDRAGSLQEVVVTAPDSPARNPAFDVTPGRLVTALVTERGVCAASAEGLRGLYPEGGR